MNIILSKDFIENSYYKAFNHNLRMSDSKSVTNLANTLFNEFISLLGDKEIDLTTIVEKRHETMDTKITNHSIINPHYRRADEEKLFSDTRGWCWSCWKTKKITELEKQLDGYQSKV